MNECREGEQGGDERGVPSEHFILAYDYLHFGAGVHCRTCDATFLGDDDLMAARKHDLQVFGDSPTPTPEDV